ncbi:4'-phosphopantetheinyl transferase superfamily protein [Hoyosella sp. YIM 151337]|uniref:4'-phosphopantetheinyl transferase family protein n=1 Tax=Hoyosella sp. YIM 151337 TaxID=2992742 RepID=UPI0022354E95|nr:4'-phosphopantetheinyl transferase superfamily protein [Hoyosella sp. YIM 151337]MCW4353887.1 4'-phosphopantetheinyl transferase superfamily protein [Hoyosella sp. YIM 151337]
MIDQIVAAPLVTAEAFTDHDSAFIPESERAAVARAVPTRQREFFTVRHLARRAMVQLGVPGAARVPILKGDRGAPVWPGGVIGSLTHCSGYRGAVVGYTSEVRSAGIDAEPHSELPSGVLPSVSLAEERNWLASAVREYGPGLHLDKLLFCAKETTYKAWFPITKRWLGFEDAHITFGVSDAQTGCASGDFTATILIDGAAISGTPVTQLHGKWLISEGLVLASIVVPRE